MILIFDEKNHMRCILRKLGLRSFTLGPEVINIFMFSSAKHDIFNAHKYKNIKKFKFHRVR